MTKKLKKIIVCIISVFCVAAFGFAIACADSSSSSSESEILTGSEDRVYEADNMPINDSSCCEEGHMVQTLAASKVSESHSSHTTQITSSTTTISSGNYYLNSDVKLNSYINVTGSVHICLNGHTLTGGSNSVIVVNGSSAVLYLHDCQGSGKITGGVGSNIIWTTGGTSQSMGGGITVANGGTLHMYGGTITGNKVGAFGGGVVVAHNSNMIMYGGTISKNTGGWLGSGGVAVMGYFLMTGGTISDNSSSSGSNGWGGGVSADTEGSYAGSVEIAGGTISGNSAVQGGGVYAYTGTTLKISGGTISGNSATSEGGGVYSLVNTTISGATITGNKTTISSSSYGGGGISVPYGTATISNCTITDNSASNGCGGGICVNSGCTATLSGCTITGNTASKYGGGIYFSGTLKISGKMIVHSNTVSKNANDIYLSSNQYVTLGGNLSSGSDVGVYFASSSQTQATTSESSTSYYKNSYSYFFPENKSGNYVATYSSYVYFTTSNAYFSAEFKLSSSVSSTRYYTDLSVAVGTASSAYDSTTTVTVKKAVSVSSSVTIASGTTVTFDTAGYKITGPSSSYLFNVKGNLTIKGKGTITGCSSSYGAIYVPSGGSLSIQDVTISGNTGSGNGGGVYIASSSCTFSMSSGSITGNTAKNGGAGIYLASKATATFTGGTVQGNTVSGSENNVYLASGATIKFSSTTNVKNTTVGVTAAGTGSSSVQITNAVNSSMTTSDIDGHIIADSCKCVCVEGGVVYFADDHNYKITGFTYIDGATGCTATSTNTCSYCKDITTTAGMAVTYGFDSNGNAFRYVEGYEEYREEFSSGFLVESASGVYTLYNTLEDALENADDGSTIHLLEDIEGDDASGAISVSGNVTIDLNGHTVERGITAGDGATVTIEDVRGGGTVTGELSEEDGGSFVLRGGTYSGNEMDYVLDRTDWDGCVCVVDGNTYTVTTASDADTLATSTILVGYSSDDGTERSVYFVSADAACTFVSDNNLSADIFVLADINVTGGLSFETEGDITISLNNHNLTGSLSVSAASAEIDLGGGSVSADLTVKADSATVALDGGSVEGTLSLSGKEAGLSLGDDGAVGTLAITDGTNTVTLDGGTVGSISVSGGQSDINFGTGEVTGGVAVTDGTVSLNLDGSEIGTDGISVSGGKVSVNLGENGTVSGDVSVSGGSAILDLYGGTVEGGLSVSSEPGEEASLTVVDTSEEKSGEVKRTVSQMGTDSTLLVQAGTYSYGSGVIDFVDWDSFVVSYNYDADTEIGTYTVVSNPGTGSYLATVTYTLDDANVTIYCDSLTDAVSIAENGQTVTLLGDDSVGVTITSSITLDLNGCTIDGNVLATGDGITVTIVDGGTKGPDKGYADGTVTGYVYATGSGSTFKITAGTYYEDVEKEYLPSDSTGTSENYVAVVGVIDAEGEGNSRRVLIVMDEQTAKGIAADAYICGYTKDGDGGYSEDTTSERTYYIQLDVALSDAAVSENGGMILVLKDSVSESPITLEGNGFVLVIDLNGNKIEVNLEIEGDYTEYGETTEADTTYPGKGASLIVTSSSSVTTPSISGSITVNGTSDDYEIGSSRDPNYQPYAVGITVATKENASTIMQTGSELELSATIAMSKDWAVEECEETVTWTICGDSVSFVCADSVSGGGSFTVTASGAVADVKIKAEKSGTAVVCATVAGKDSAENDVNYTDKVTIVVRSDGVAGVTINEIVDTGSVSIENGIVLTLPGTEPGDGGDTASLEAVIAMSPEGAEYVGSDIVWKSLNEEIATVTACCTDPTKATVKGCKAGVTLITVTVDGVESGYVTVIVTGAVSGGADGQSGQYVEVEDGSVILPRLADGYELWFTEDVKFDNNDNLKIYEDATESSSNYYWYVITGTASRMTEEQAYAFNGGSACGAKKGDPYVIIGISVGAGESIYKGSDTTGTALWTNGEETDGYYIVMIALENFGYAVYTVTNSGSCPVTYVISFVEMTDPEKVTVSSVTIVPSATAAEPNGEITFNVVITYSDNTVRRLSDLGVGDLTYYPDGITWTVCGCECGDSCGCGDSCECTCGCGDGCVCIVKGEDGTYTFKSDTEGEFKIFVTVNDGESSFTSNVVTVTVATGTSYEISVTSEGNDSLTAADGKFTLTTGGKYTLALTAGSSCAGEVGWISTDTTIAKIETTEDSGSVSYVLDAQRAGTVTVYAVVGGEAVAKIEVTISDPVTEDPGEPEVDEKEYSNSYEDTLRFTNGVEYTTDLRVVINIYSTVEEDNMGYTFELVDGTGEGTCKPAEYAIVSGHIHHYLYPVWSLSDDGTITLRFICDCKAGETDENGYWVTYEWNVNDTSSSDWGWSVTCTVTVDECTKKVTAKYSVSVTLRECVFKKMNSDVSGYEAPEYASDTPYTNTELIDGETVLLDDFVLYPVIMVEYADENGVVATLYFEDVSTAVAVTESLLAENGGYGSATMTLLSDVTGDFEITSGTVTINLNGFDITGSVIVSNTGSVTIEDDNTTTSTTAHGEKGSVTGTAEADGDAGLSLEGGSYPEREVARYVAEGYAVVYDGDNSVYTVVPASDLTDCQGVSAYEAKIDVTLDEDTTYTIYYSALEDALADAGDGDKVTLLKNINEGQETTTYKITGSIVLDLGGYTLNGSVTTAAGTNVTIEMNGGTIEGDVTAGGGLTLHVGTTGEITGGVTVSGEAKIQLDGGTIEGSVALKGDSSVCLGGGTIKGGVTVSGGADADIDLGGGTICGGISVSGGSSVEITDSTATDEQSYGTGFVTGEISVEGSSLEICGGAYTYDVTDFVTDDKVVFVSSYTPCGGEPVTVYTVMKECEAKGMAEVSRTYINTAGDGKTVYYACAEKALKNLAQGDTLTVWSEEVTLSGGLTIDKNDVTLDLNGNTVTADVTVSAAGVAIDLDGGTIKGDITAEADSSLYITNGSEKGGTVTGKVSGDAVAVEIDAGTYGSDVLEYITDGKVIYVNAKNSDGNNTYTVTTADEIDAEEMAVGATVTYGEGEDEVTVYFEDPKDAVEYAKKVSKDGVTAYVTLCDDLDYTESEPGGIVTEEGNDIVINLNGNGIKGDITVVYGSSLTIEDTDPHTYDGDINDVELVDGTIKVEGGTLSVTGGIYTDDISGYLSDTDYALVSQYYDKSTGTTTKIYEITSEDLAKDSAKVSVTEDGEKPVYHTDVATAIEAVEDALEGGCNGITITVWSDDVVEDADFVLPSGDVTIDFNGNALEGDIILGTDEGETKVTLTFTDSEAGDDGISDGGFTGTVTAAGEDTISEVILEAGTYNEGAFDDFDGNLTFAEICDGDGNVVDRYVPVYGDETFTVVPESTADEYSVAGVDTGDGLTVYFTDIDDALKYAAKNGGTLTLYGDAESSETIDIYADVTIDLNGHSLIADNIVIHADENDGDGEGGSLLITHSEDGGRIRGGITIIVSDDGYAEDANPYDETLVLEIKPMEGDLVVAVVNDEKDFESLSECYVFSETEDGFRIVNIADHEHCYNVPVWEYEMSGEYEGMMKLTFKCACGKFDDFVGYYRLTATENEDGTVTFTAEAEIFSEAHKGTYTYDETKKVAAKVNVDGRTIYYDDINEAVEAAEGSKATLVLMDDFSGDLYVSSDVTLDLNGHDLSGTIFVGDTTSGEDVTLIVEGEGRVDASIELDTGADIVVGGGTYDDGNFDDVSGNIADGCAVVIGKDSDGNTVYTVCDASVAEENSEAAITRDGKTTYYESIEDAVNALEDGDTLVLWDDVESGLTIDADNKESIEIDLNGKEILGGINIESSGDTGNTTVITVTDSTSSEEDKGDGKVVGGITLGEGVTLVIEGGTYSAGTEGDVASEGGNAYDEDLVRNSVTTKDKAIFNNADGSISVVDETVAEALAGAVVTWTDDKGEEHKEYYEILQDAVADAAGLEDAVVTLYEDNPTDITISGDVTIDLNGHTQEGDITVNTGATLTLTDSSDDNSGMVDGKVVTKVSSDGDEASGKIILSGGTYDFDSFDEDTLENVSLGKYTDENGDEKRYVAVYGDIETSVDGEGNETVSGTFTVMTEEEVQNSGAVKVTITTDNGDGTTDTKDVYFIDLESALEYASETDGKVTLYGDAASEEVIEITGEVEIDLNGHTLDADIIIDAESGASLTVTDSSDGEGELKGTVIVILDDDASEGAYGETFTVDGGIDINDLDVSLKDGSADGDDAENFFFAGSEEDGYGICTGEHKHAYGLVSMVYDEKSCTVTIIIKCACGEIFTTAKNVAVTFGEYTYDDDEKTGTVTGSAEISADTDGDGTDEDYRFEITLTDPEAEVVTEDGETYYFESLDDAISFAAEKAEEDVSAEIFLLTDVENIIVTGDESVVIDLDGHTVTGTVSVDEDASLTIKGRGEIEARIDVRGDLTIDGVEHNETTGEDDGKIIIRPDDTIDVAEGGTLTIEGVVEIILDGTDLDIGSTYVEVDGDGETAEYEFSYGVVIDGDLTITVEGDSTLTAEGGFTITNDGSLTINIADGTLTLDTDGNAVEADVTVEGGAGLVAEDTSGTNEGRLDGKVTVEEGGYVAFEDETFADEGNGLEIVFEGNTETEEDKYIMESAADEYGDTYYQSTTMEEHLAHGHAFDSLGAYVYNEETGKYDIFVEYVFDPSMSVITMYFTCLCGETLTYSVYLTEDDYYAFVTETGEGDETKDIVVIVYSLTAVVVSTNGTSAEYALYGTAQIPMFTRADDATRSDPESYEYTEDNPYYYGAEDASCTEGGEDVYIYGTQNGVIIRESVGIIHHGLEVSAVVGDHTIYHCTLCGSYFMDGYTDIAGGEGEAYTEEEIYRELEREEIFNSTKDELLSELESRLTGCTGDSGAAKEAYDKAVSEIDGWEFEFGGGSSDDRDEYLDTLLSEIERAAAEAEFAISEETQKTISENEIKELFKDILDEDGNVTEKYEEYYDETAQQQIRELYDTALQDLGNFGFSVDDVDVTDSENRYLEYTEWLDEMYGVYVQRIADALKAVDVLKVDTHEELSDKETIYSYVSNDAGMSGTIKLIITKVDGGKLDKAIGKAEIVSGDEEMTAEEMEAALDGKSVIGVYDFKLWDTLYDVQVITFNGYYCVCLQLPEDLQGRDDLQIVYLGDDGVLEVYSTYVDIDAGCLYFTTTHFSQYIIMGIEEKDLMPPIIVLSVFGGMELVALVILVAVFAVRKKKENVVEEDAPAKKKLAGLGILPLLAVIIPTGAVGIIIGLAVANALFIAGIIVFIYLLLTKTGKGVVEYEVGSSDGSTTSGASNSLQDGLASNCSAIDEANRNNS